MKKYCLMIIYAIWFNPINSQTPNFTPFAFGVSFGGNISMAKPNGIAQTEFEKKNSTGYHIGLLASFRKPKYYLETGLEYLSEGYSYKIYNKEITKPTLDNIIYEHQFFALAIPLKLSIPFPDRYVTHLINFGLTPKIILKQTDFNQTNYKNGTTEKEILNQKSEYSGFYPSINLAYALDIPVNYNEESIRIEPYAQFSFINAKKETLSNTLTGFGLKVTFFWLQ